MAEVVYRLLMITTPDHLFMGQKDFQQFAIIRKLIQIGTICLLTW
ncbi:MAG: pantoate--beta-alanine ligase [Saprospiraceae bacterium]|nr:pantoate--beta-alanine ligase [Candidatus Opimibacter iunctus]